MLAPAEDPEAIAIRVLQAISEHRHPEIEDVLALERFSGLEWAPDELACEVINRGMLRRRLARENGKH